jgi:S-phase kinase-associated protein 1
MLEDASENEVQVIPLPNVDSKILSKIIEYLKYHKTNPAEPIETPLRRESKIEDVLCEWDRKFVEIDQSIISDLMISANYMNIAPLLKLMAVTVAFQIRGKSTQEVRELFGIENDFTEEEEKKIREENKWCEEQ